MRWASVHRICCIYSYQKHATALLLTFLIKKYANLQIITKMVVNLRNG